MAHIYLEIPGIKGGCKDNKHKDQIELQTWNWGLINNGTTEKTAACQHVAISKSVDRSSPLLMKLCSDGKKKDKATIYVDLRDKDDLVLELSPIRVISHRIGSGQDEKGKPTVEDHFTIKFNKMSLKYVAKDKSNHPFERDFEDSDSDS